MAAESDHRGANTEHGKVVDAGLNLGTDTVEFTGHGFFRGLLAVADEAQCDPADIAEGRGVVLAELVGADVIAETEQVAGSGHMSIRRQTFFRAAQP
ncbi:MAG: hypothetical protein K8R87_07245 [Verrucomicrobia bacterium]|nr:hypothetical protein [Verrucomicrobiota bacterium]